MDNLSLTVCSFLIKKKNNKKNDYFSYIELNSAIKDNKGKTYENIIEVFNSFFSYHSDMEIDDKNNSSFCCSVKKIENKNKEFNHTFTIIKSGEYGSSSSIVNKDSKKEVFKVGANDIFEKPFYFYITCPTDINNEQRIKKGLFIFQNSGRYGIKTVTLKNLSKYLSEEFNLILVTRNVSPEMFMKMLVKPDTIKDITLIKNKEFTDDADKITFGYGKETRTLTNLILKPASTIMNKINYFSNNKNTLFEFENQKYNDVKLDVKIGDMKRRISLHNLEHLSIIEYMPNEIELDGIKKSITDFDGHPKELEMLIYLEKTAERYMKEMALVDVII